MTSSWHQMGGFDLPTNMTHTSANEWSVRGARGVRGDAYVFRVGHVRHCESRGLHSRLADS